MTPPPIPTFDWGLKAGNTPGWLGYPWYAVVDDTSHDTGNWTYKSSQETMTIAVNWADEVNVKQAILGFNLVGSDSTGAPIIERFPPIKHPRNQQLFATAVTINRIAPKYGFIQTATTGNASIGVTTLDVEDGTPFVANVPVVVGWEGANPEMHTVASSTAGTIVLNEALVNPQLAGAIVSESNTMAMFPIAGGALQAGPVYVLSLFTINFAALPYVCLNNADTIADIGSLDESQRYVEYKNLEGAEYISRENNFYNWAESDASIGLVAGPNSTVNASIGNLLMKPTFQLIWHRVPWKYILDSNFNPKNIRACESTVNAVAFFGRAIGTLLCLEAVIEPHEAPVGPTVMNLASWQPPREYTVTFNYKEFKPDSGKGTYQGHNLLPNPKNGRWYLVTSNGDPVTGTPQYGSSTFSTMFAGIT